ncbi:hypothetical protein [Paenibacillus sp. TH7-28]
MLFFIIVCLVRDTLREEEMESNIVIVESVVNNADDEITGWFLPDGIMISPHR